MKLNQRSTFNVQRSTFNVVERSLRVWLSSLAFAFTVATSGAAAPTEHVAGCSYFHEKLTQGPWSIHGVKIDRGSADIKWHTTQGQGLTLGVGTLTAQVKTLPASRGQPIAAINGDFAKAGLQYQAHPVGLQIMRGELVCAPGPDACFWIAPDSGIHAQKVTAQLKVTWPNSQVTPVGLNDERTNGGAMLYSAALGASTRTGKGRELILHQNGTDRWLPLAPGETISARVAEVRETGNSPLTPDTLVLSLSPRLMTRLPEAAAGMVLKIATDLTPDLRGVTTAIGGGPLLVQGGKSLAFAKDSKSYLERHPRTAVGWNDQYAFLVVVDGRQKKLSMGMTLPELAAYLIKLGCQEAINLDGGGSSTFWWRGQVMNSPCEGRERPMVNALVLVQETNSSSGAGLRALGSEFHHGSVTSTGSSNTESAP